MIHEFLFLKFRSPWILSQYGVLDLESQWISCLIAKADLHLSPVKYRQSARISVIVHRFRQYDKKYLLLDTVHEVRYSAA